MNTSSGPGAGELRPNGEEAAEVATEKNSVRVPIPLIGTVKLPPPEQLAFVAGIAALAALEVIEWPVGVALAVGHVLATSSHNKVIQDFGKALEEV